MGFKPRQDLLLLLFLNIVFCLCFFYPILGRLNTIMMSVSGDGIKNYFCYLYFIGYDQGTHFTGMNYPFGENILFTDNMPALAWSIAKLKAWFPGITKYSLVLMHSTFLISYVLCSFFLYNILQLFKVKGWWAVVAAVFIAYFSPQFFRLFGHFSLGLVCFFPMVIYWIMQYERSRKWKYLLFLFVATTLFTFLHVYYLAFAFVLVLAYCFSYCLVQRKPLLQKIKYSVPLLLSVVAAVLFLKGYLVLTDPVTDRPVSPNGYTGTVATFQDIFTSYYNFIGSNAFAWIFGGSSRWTEGYGYLGLITILVLLFLLYRLLRWLFLKVLWKRKVAAHPVRSYRVWLITAFLLLLFSMGVPFIWGMDFLLEYIPVFKQFRSIGRFSWIFYYLIMIYAAIFLSRLFHYMRSRNYHKQYAGLLILIIAVYLIEWNGYGQTMREECYKARSNYDKFTAHGDASWPDWLRQKGYPAEKFQGIIGLPYTHIGAEKVGMQEDYHNVILCGAEIACTTGLKMTDVMMSRTSWSQTFANLRLCDGPFTPKPIADLFNSKPFLVFVSHNVPLMPGEKHLIKDAAFIGTRGDIDLYALDLKAMIQKDKYATDSIKKIIAALPEQEGLLYATPNAFHYSNHFDQDAFHEPFAGKGAHATTTAERELLATIKVSHTTADSLFLLSAWFLCYSDSPDMPYLSFKQYDKQNGLLAEGDLSAGKSTYTIVNWFKAEKEIQIGYQVEKIVLYVHGGSKKFIALDEVLLYPSHGIYFYKANHTKWLVDNRP